MTASTPKSEEGPQLSTVKIAVIGLGPAGLSAIKALREEGFEAIGFERRERVGGVWSYSSNSSYTSVVPETVSNVSSLDLVTFQCKMVRYNSEHHHRPISDHADDPDLPPYMTGAQVGEFLESYARHFDLEKHIRFETTVRKVLRDKADKAWNVHIISPDGGDRILKFDKIVFGSGSESIPSWPPMPGRKIFQGTVIHGQSYRKHASKVYQSYRRGRIIISRYDGNGVPTDLTPWTSLQFKYMTEHKAPWIANRLANHLTEETMFRDMARHDLDTCLSDRQRYKRAQERIRGEWRLFPHANMEFTHPAVQDDFMGALYSGAVAPVHGFRAFVGESSVLLGNGSTVEVDAVIFCTGYTLEYSLMPELEMDGACGVPLTTAGQANKMSDPGVPKEVSLPRLYHMIFPPKWASSVAFLSWISALETAWCVCELASMAVTQIWAAETSIQQGSPAPPRGYRKLAQLPSVADMNASVDDYHTWWRLGRTKEPSAHAGLIRPYPFYRFLHDMAGTGMYENAGPKFSLRNFKLRFRDRALYNSLTRGPASSHIWRVFDTNPRGIPGCGRRAWPHARQMVEDAYRNYEEFLQKTKHSP
ncbi:dimethylaniline monooxygenase 2 [Fusarium tjaetaba]|uniref:Dimethylaniline monooxygenase 2 n=1 Tax=Fusarium tjaetaba TaxID=1567544 RepID=A0A8H5RID4_9HYPO|nr:dimethylaniline monooxygenase 2 [Fusarium tjaetaba]KAF5633022.1 dimethylaniline monooxygenase 2 [Fusarium tjaetaba]